MIIRNKQRSFMIVSVTLMVLALSGCASPRFSFDIAVDMRSYTPPDHPGPDYFLGVARAIRDTGRGDFMLSPGDCDPPDRVKAVIDQVFGKDYPWYPVVGNHEIEEPANMVWLRNYNAGGRKLPGIVRPGPSGAVETCYSFDHQNAHFAVVNQYFDGLHDDVKGGALSDALFNWLAEDLAATKKPLVFVVGHEPHVVIPDMDSGAVRHRGDSLDADETGNHRFWSLLRKHHVTAYLCGHTHCTSVSRINGMWQIDAGHARGRSADKSMSSFIKIWVEGQSVRCDVYRCENPGKAPYKITWSERLR